MARARKNRRKSTSGTKLGGDGATTGYEAELWRMADTLRSPSTRQGATRTAHRDDQQHQGRR